MGVRSSAPVQTGPGAHPASYKMGTSSFTRVNRSGYGVNHASPSGVEVKERVELYLYSPSVPSWQDIGWTWPFDTSVCVFSPGCVISKLKRVTCYWRTVAGQRCWVRARRLCVFISCASSSVLFLLSRKFLCLNDRIKTLPIRKYKITWKSYQCRFLFEETLARRRLLVTFWPGSILEDSWKVIDQNSPLLLSTQQSVLLVWFLLRHW
jgi:hypothetical protein